MLAPIFAADPASPRLTVYDETQGSRMEFSGVTLDNWANKIANMFTEEFDSPAPDSPTVLIDLPVTWQCAVIILGAYAAGIVPCFEPGASDLESPGIVFTTEEHQNNWPEATDVVVVSADPFGRGVVEVGGTLSPGAIDFGPTVRFYGDQFFGDGFPASHFAPTNPPTPSRTLITGWSTLSEFDDNVMAPLMGGGSVVIVTGMASTDRLAHIADTEKVTATP
ncbi:hypothetical protein CAQUA_09195 [Corynebacterium aquatimens]|nr:hypothetical protein CAQUA_09195 [Corynebacterium aquatimens]